MHFAWVSVVTCLAIFKLTQGDLYLHNPRGSNNRLHEKTAVRTNANRLFDSQNNNRGGYNVGDSTSEPHGSDEGKQYRMKYFQSGPASSSGQTHLAIEWTNQHGCGGNEDSNPQKQNCALVLQYMCQDDANTATGSDDTIRNGVQTAAQDYTKPKSLTETETVTYNRKNGNVKNARGLHEQWEWYDKCNVRERNKGLFTADQVLRGNNGLGYSSAIYTRQNPNGNRRGYECPEERDYYPYWHPTAWKDIAVLAENGSMCSHYESKSFNTQPYGECVEFFVGNKRKPSSRWNNEADCSDNGGTWTLFSNYLERAPQYTSPAQCSSNSDGVKYIWAVPYDAVDITKSECLVALSKPDCMEAPWTRSNHLGNSVDGQPLNYDWILPYFPSGNTKRCVLRMRYNISTDDYDPYFTFHQEISPIKQNPYVNVGAGSSPLRLAINTAQYGRTFQDRSHAFLLAPRSNEFMQQKIVNLNVRGKRGNIVQVYPAVEYDFFPTNMKIKDGDLVHIQWTGSNTHNNNAPAGDGQAGNAGEGKEGTDRSNMVQIADLNDNYPMPFEKSTMWSNAQVMWIHHEKSDNLAKDLAVNLASSGYYRCIKNADCPGSHRVYSVESKDELNNLLNNAPASYAGVLLKFAKGTYHYMCSRNNNFTNRSQKGTITVA